MGSFLRPCLFAFFFLWSSSALSSVQTNVLVWDLFFDFKDPLLRNEQNFGSFGKVISLDSCRSEENKNHGRGLHGLQISYLLLHENPGVRLHLVYNSGFPWQDPEKCSLIEDAEFNRELERHSYPKIKNCRSEAAASIKALTKFIKENKIKVVNISHGTFFDHYNKNNPYLLSARYRDVDIDFIFRFLYRNFLAIFEVVRPLFEDNPDVLFVLAAGNNGDEVDRLLYLKGFDYIQRPVPTMFASLTSQFDNVVSVASSYTGSKLAGGSNYGKENVYVARQIGSSLVPDGKGNLEPFGGTSAAAAETSRLALQALALKPRLEAARIKDLLGQTVRLEPNVQGLVTTGGYINDQKFLERVKEEPENPPVRYVDLTVVSKTANSSAFKIPAELNPKGYGCHSIAVDSKDRIWMTFPWADAIAMFEPKTSQFTPFFLPTANSRPDGIAVDAEGNAWAGVYEKGGLVKVDGTTGVVTEYPHPKESALNITAIGSGGEIWATGHRAKVVSRLYPSSGSYEDWVTEAEWPLDLAFDTQNGSLWATNLKGYGVPWGPGAIFHKPRQGKPEYFPLPIQDERLQAYWVAIAQDKILATLMGDGFLTLHKSTHEMRFFRREDRKNLYQIVRRLDANRFVMANHLEKMKTLDVYDFRKPDEIVSYYLPNQVGEPREALGFDSQGRVWYCEVFTDTLEVLSLDQ